MKRAIISILVVGLFLTVAAVPATSSVEPKSDGEDKVLSIMIGADGKGIKGDAVTISAADAEKLTNDITEFKTWIEENRPFKDFQITEEEKTEIREKATEILNSINTILEENDLGLIDSNWLWDEMFETEFGRSTICSVGVGYAFIPFYEYETFLGVMLRPMWLWYPPLILGGGGYTGNLNINLFPPRIEYGDRLGHHLVRTTIFTGLYINIGDLGYDNMFGGLMLLLGRARVVM